MKFIHCADLHLDSKMEGLPTDKSKIRRDEVVATFERLCEYSQKNHITAVIIAGDMFDTAHVTIRTRDRVINAIKKSSDVDYIYLSGNHDQDNFISSLDNVPLNLKIVKEQWTAFYYKNVTINALSLNSINAKTIYDTLNLDENMINIVALHGQVAGYKSNEQGEIISIPRLKDKNIDYLALGHIHSYSEGQIDLRGKYVYSGCLDGRGFDELGDKGFVLLEVVENSLTNTFVKFSSRNLYEYDFSVDVAINWYDCVEKIKNELCSNYSSDSLIKIILKGEHNADFYVDTQGLLSKLSNLFFFVKVYDKTTLKVDMRDYENDKSIRGEFVRAVYESDLSEENKSNVILIGLNALKGEEF